MTYPHVPADDDQRWCGTDVRRIAYRRGRVDGYEGTDVAAPAVWRRRGVALIRREYEVAFAGHRGAARAPLHVSVRRGGARSPGVDLRRKNGRRAHVA